MKRSSRVTIFDRSLFENWFAFTSEALMRTNWMFFFVLVAVLKISPVLLIASAVASVSS